MSDKYQKLENEIEIIQRYIEELEKEKKHLEEMFESLRATPFDPPGMPSAPEEWDNEKKDFWEIQDKHKERLETIKERLKLKRVELMFAKDQLKE